MVNTHGIVVREAKTGTKVQKEFFSSANPLFLFLERSFSPYRRHLFLLSTYLLMLHLWALQLHHPERFQALQGYRVLFIEPYITQRMPFIAADCILAMLSFRYLIHYKVGQVPLSNVSLVIQQFHLSTFFFKENACVYKTQRFWIGKSKFQFSFEHLSRYVHCITDGTIKLHRGWYVATSSEMPLSSKRHHTSCSFIIDLSGWFFFFFPCNGW